MSKYNVPVGGDTVERKNNDAWLAEKIIFENSEALHHFLYDGTYNHHVNSNNLRSLLTIFVNQEELVKYPFIAEALRATPDRKKDLLNHVFRYEYFSSQKEICQLVKLLDVKVCPYCNRLFITTVTEGDKTMRPQLDHYRNKSDYPFLALSILNLVPCCGVCNHIKSDNALEILYPYVEGIGNAYSFSVDSPQDLTALTGTRYNQESLTLSLKSTVPVSSFTERIDASIKMLNLDAVYQSHLSYVADLLFQRYIFTDDMLKEIRTNFSDLFQTENEIREMLVLGKLDQKYWGDRPLGKLTHDISKQLDELYLNRKE